MAIWHEDQLLIDGELLGAEGGRTYDTVNPAEPAGEPLAHR